jgi:DNA-binding beta-propeller fold protein YncE
VLNASNLAIIGTIGLPGCCALQFALDEKAQFLYAATGTNYVYVVNAAMDTLAKSVEVTQSGQNSTNVIVADTVTGRIFVSSSPGGSVLQIDGPDGHVSRLLNVSSQVAGLALDTKTQELYVANYHQLTVFDARGPGAILLVALAVVAVVVVGAVGVYFIVRRRDGRKRREIQGAPGDLIP